jgi:hypothetical protein
MITGISKLNWHTYTMQLYPQIYRWKTYRYQWSWKGFNFLGSWFLSPDTALAERLAAAAETGQVNGSVEGGLQTKQLPEWPVTHDQNISTACPPDTWQRLSAFYNCNCLNNKAGCQNEDWWFLRIHLSVSTLYLSKFRSKIIPSFLSSEAFCELSSTPAALLHNFN